MKCEKCGTVTLWKKRSTAGMKQDAKRWGRCRHVHMVIQNGEWVEVQT